MSKIYCCEFGNKDISCKRVFQEENEEDANRYAQRRAGGMGARMQIKVIRDGQRIYQMVVFSKKENEGYVNIKSNKIMTLKRSDIKSSISTTLPEEAKTFLSSVTGVSFDEESDADSSKQESFIRKLLFV